MHKSAFILYVRDANAPLRYTNCNEMQKDCFTWGCYNVTLFFYNFFFSFNFICTLWENSFIVIIFNLQFSISGIDLFKTFLATVRIYFFFFLIITFTNFYLKLAQIKIKQESYIDLFFFILFGFVFYSILYYSVKHPEHLCFEKRWKCRNNKIRPIYNFY